MQVIVDLPVLLIQNGQFLPVLGPLDRVELGDLSRVASETATVDIEPALYQQIPAILGVAEHIENVPTGAPD